MATCSKQVSDEVSKVKHMRFRHPKEGHCNSHRANPHFLPSAPRRAAHTQPCQWVQHGFEGECKHSVLGEYLKGTRVETANVGMVFIKRIQKDIQLTVKTEVS